MLRTTHRCVHRNATLRRFVSTTEQAAARHWKADDERRWKHRFQQLESLHSNWVVKYNEQTDELKEAKRQLRHWRVFGVSTSALLLLSGVGAAMAAERRDSMPRLL
jgi:hypothetical protein